MGGKLVMNRVGGVLAVTRAFGDTALKQQGLISKPEVKRIPIRLHHRYVIVASDGLWDYVPLKTIQKIVKEEVESDDIALRLVKAAIAEGSYDNISVIVVRL
jgi:serine/threonine protein phosphatase PrpC